MNGAVPQNGPALGKAPVEALVSAAAAGDEEAWGLLVDRFAPLIWGVTRRFQLSRADAADVNQTVWLQLVQHLSRIREPAALPLWIARTAHNECLRMLRTSRRVRAFDPVDDRDPLHRTALAMTEAATVDEEMMRAERHQVLRAGLAQLPARCQRLFAMLLGEPPMSYEQIAIEMNTQVGSVGPIRARCLDKLRATAALKAFAGDRHIDGRDGRHDTATLG